MTTEKREKRKVVKPDEYFAEGPFEFARFGKVTVVKSHLTAEQIAAGQASMAAKYSTVVAEIEALVTSIAAQIARLPPGQLLQHAWWELAMMVIGVNGKESDDSDRLDAMRMVDYVQSVIASVTPETYVEQIGEEDWTRLQSDIKTLFHRLTIEYQAHITAHRKAQNPDLDMELEEFRMRAEVLWLNIRGKRYQLHERQALLDVLTPHSDVFTRLFGIDAVGLVNELDKVLYKLTHGLADAAAELRSFRAETSGRYEALARQHPGLGVDEIHAKLFEDNDLAERGRRFFSGVFGLDMFDVAKNTTLPQALLDSLSWSPGEDAEFFAPGAFQGWPLRIWPVMKRPFIRLEGRILCFDIFSLFDNIYRVLQRLITRHLEPSYSGTWNNRQKAATEELPFTYLSRLLSGARIYRPVYYRWSASGGASEWHEADGILIFDDHLIVVEVKAGAFTYTSPADDLPAHLVSLRNLLQAPARQGSRFVDYLESAQEVGIFDENHVEIARVRRRDFRHVTVCAVTLDAFTTLAARAQRLAPVGIDVGQRAVWPLSIDDLRVYADLFDNPLVFLHFIEQRVRAGRSRFVDLNDEMDHFGLYIEHNNYSQHAAELMANELDRLSFNGYQTPADEYFHAVARRENPTLPHQKMPSRLAEIVDFLGRSSELRRSELVSFLLDAHGDFRDEFAATIDQALGNNEKLGRARPMSVYGGMAMTLYVWSPAAPRLKDDARDHTRTVMLAHDEASRPLIELEYASDGKLVGAHMVRIGLVEISTTELERLKVAAISMKHQRVEKARAEQKIGRNEPCPCGSGKKFKQCHGKQGAS